LARGREVLEDFFPGLTEDLIARGAVAGDPTRDVLWHCAGGFHARFASGLTGVLVSRPLLEAAIRARVLALPNVAAIDDCDAIGLSVIEDRGRVSGIVVRRRATGAEEILAGDLVVDAGGRASKSPAWLAALGYEVPREEEVLVGIGYATRRFRRHPDDLGGALGMIVAAEPPNPSSAVALAQEGDTWIVSAAGYAGRHPPADADGFATFLRQVPCRAIHDLVHSAEPISDFATFNFPSSLRRRYEYLDRFPEGLLVFGDAICRFNPVFGQGMTVAALQAAALSERLAAGRSDLARAFFRRAAKLIDVPWQIAAGADLAHPGVVGRRGAMTRFFNWYIPRLHRAAHGDPAASIAFHKVANLMAPPASILAPRIAWRVLRGNLALSRRRKPQLRGAPRLASHRRGLDG
ncbi:MAG: monooxygenase, partial [Alphaproteobacteria bacterium]